MSLESNSWWFVTVSRKVMWVLNPPEGVFSSTDVTESFWVSSLALNLIPRNLQRFMPVNRLSLPFADDWSRQRNVDWWHFARLFCHTLILLWLRKFQRSWLFCWFWTRNCKSCSSCLQEVSVKRCNPDTFLCLINDGFMIDVVVTDTETCLTRGQEENQNYAKGIDFTLLNNSLTADSFCFACLLIPIYARQLLVWHAYAIHQLQRHFSLSVFDDNICQVSS